MKKWKFIATEALSRVLRLEKKVAQLETVMGQQKAEVDARFQAIDTETNTLASEITDLRTQIANGLSPEDTADVLAKLDSLSTRLTGIAADPNNPVPTPTPTPTPPV